MGAILLSWKGITRNHHSTDSKKIAAVRPPKPQPVVDRPTNPPKKPA